MENAPADFLPRLEEALAQRAAWLEATRIPQLKDLLGTYRSLFEGMTDTLFKKGLLREDPYDHEGTVNDITVPADSALSGSGDAAEVSRRIVAYRRQMDFLVDSLPLTLASVDLAALKSISSLLSYLDWASFGESSHSPTTRALARLVTSVRMSRDGMSSRVLQESQTQMEKVSRDIGARVAELEAWHRESWKAAVRAKVLPHVPPHTAVTAEERTARTLAIRKAFEEAMPGSTWHPQLAQEILGEDGPPGSAERMERLIASLAVPRPAVPDVHDAPLSRGALRDAVRKVSRAAGEIGSCEEVLVENEGAIERRRLSFLQRVRRWFQKSLGRLDDRFYEIELRPAPGADPKTETIDFLRFVSEMNEMKSVLAEIMQPGSPGHHRVETMDEGGLSDFLDWQIRELRHLHRRMEGLNTLFQVKAVHERGGTAKSIKLELLAIENLLNRAEAARRP